MLVAPDITGKRKKLRRRRAKVRRAFEYASFVQVKDGHARAMLEKEFGGCFPDAFWMCGP
ncbi:hypothetical protein D3C72_1989190 [compost metagenome]